MLTVGTIFGAAIFHVLLIQSEFRLDQLNKEAAKEQVRYEKLRLDVAQLSAPERIVATAQQRLGMVVPPQVAYLMAPAPPSANPDDPAAPSLAGGWAEVKPHLGTPRPLRSRRDDHGPHDGQRAPDPTAAWPPGGPRTKPDGPPPPGG